MKKIKIPRWRVYYTDAPNIAFFNSERRAKKYAAACELAEVRDGNAGMI
ncbi:MAG: hypothetical protein WAW23_05635 [Candidatus Methanoperedens sp.]